MIVELGHIDNDSSDGISNRALYEKLAENRMDKANFKVIDFELSNGPTDNDRWNQIRDRLNRVYGSERRKWIDNGADAITGTSFITQLLAAREIYHDKPLVLYFKNYIPGPSAIDEVSTWLETLTGNLSGWDAKYSGYVFIVISTPLGANELKAKGSFLKLPKIRP